MFRRFFYGRNGSDGLSVASLIAAILMSFLGTALHFRLFLTLSYALLIYSLFRVLSRNVFKRREENAKFMSYFYKAKDRMRAKINEFKSLKTHKFYRCPSCRLKLRLPRGKGKIQITCPKCKTVFERKT